MLTSQPGEEDSPCFDHKKLPSIRPKDIINWTHELLEKGDPGPTAGRLLWRQVFHFLNHDIRYYNRAKVFGHELQDLGNT